MRERTWTEFGGVAGTVLFRSLSFTSLISGLAMGFVLATVIFITAITQAPAMANPMVQIIFGLFLARYAVNGLYGEWNGTVFSNAGGSWAHVAQIATRYLVLTALWTIPLFLAGMRPEAMMSAGMGMVGPKILALLGIYVVLSTLAPPLFLIVSVTAQSFGDIFSPSHWQANLSGRRNDLFALYSVYSGAIGMAFVLLVLPVAGAFAVNVKLGFVAMAVAGAFMFGLMINLLGRLSGFFACGDLGFENPVSQPETYAGSPEPALPAAPAPVATPSVVGLSADPSPLLATGSTGAKLPPLLDAHARIERAMRRLDLDPEGTLNELNKLREAFAPHPHVLQATAICLYKSERTDAGVAIANEAFPLCFERGHIQFCAELFSVMKSHVDKLELNLENRVAIGIALDRTGDLAGAAKAFSTVVDENPGEVRAVKGLLGVADRILNERQKPAAAARVYEYLLGHCSDSPLAEYMRDGLEQASRKQESAPVS